MLLFFLYATIFVFGASDLQILNYQKMKFPNLKITAFLTIIIVVLLTSCEIEDFNIDPISERNEEFLFQTEKTFCKNDPELKSGRNHLNTITMEI